MAETASQDSVREAMDLAKQLQRSFAARDHMIDQMVQLVYQKRTIPVPQAYNATTVQVHSPIIGKAALDIIAALSENQPTFHFEPTGVGDAALRNQELREHFFDASWERQQRDVGRKLFRLMIDDQVVKGSAVLKRMARSQRAWRSYGPNAKALRVKLDARVAKEDDPLDQAASDREWDRATEKMKQQLPYPIVTTLVAPETFYYVRGEDGFNLCVERKEIEYFDAAANYSFGVTEQLEVVPASMGAPEHKPYTILGGQKLTMTEIWDASTGRTRYYLSGPGDQASGSGHLVRDFAHGLTIKDSGVLRGPYFMAYGLDRSSTAPEYAGLSIFYAYREIFPLLDSFLTMLYQAAYKFAYPSLREKPIPGDLPQMAVGLLPMDTDQRQRPVRVGEMLRGDIDYLNAPPVGEALTGAIQESKTQAQGVMPAVLQGLISGDESGYLFNQATWQAGVALKPALDNAEFALEQATGHESWIIENRIREKVSVWGEAVGEKGQKGWLAVGPDELDGIHRYTVQLKMESPSAKVIKVRYWEDMIRNRFATVDEAIEDLGGSAAEVNFWWDMYDLKKSPIVQQFVMMHSFQDLGTIDQAELGGPEAVQGALGAGPTAGLVPTTEQPAPGGAPANPVGAGSEASGAGPQVFQPGQNGQPLLPPKPSGGQPTGNPVVGNPAGPMRRANQ